MSDQFMDGFALAMGMALLATTLFQGVVMVREGLRRRRY